MVRTRFAPSPTGFLHVGGLRTALYDFLFARKHGGKFILRIEDTDRAREVKGAVESLISALHWAGLDFDEGPYIQSQRTHLYRKFADQLLESGHAYRCFCTAERLEQMRREQEEHKQAPMYDRKCAGLAKEEMEKLMEQKVPHVVRQKIRSSKQTVGWNDLVRGEIQFELDKIDDQVLLKSGGFPTYHLANVVDDHLMEITHVIRGEDWLSSTPKHLLLYEALGWQPPQFSHLPLLLNKDRSKLSKRQGDTAVEDYRAKGYLPEALVNFVALLGWHPGAADTAKGEAGQEIFSLAELTEKFTLEKVHKGGAVFDLEKLDWMNWQWQRKKFLEAPGEHGEKLVALAVPHIPKEWQQDKDFLQRCLKTVEEKLLQQPREARQYIIFYFNDAPAAPEALICNPKMKVDKAMAKKSLGAALEALEGFEKFDDMEALKTCLSGVVAKHGVKNGQIFWPVRVALTGEQFSPGVFEVLWALGKEKSLERLAQALKNL